MQNETYGEMTEEMMSVRAAEARFLSRAVSCFVFAAADIVLSVTGLPLFFRGLCGAGICLFTYILSAKEIHAGFAALSARKPSDAALRSFALVGVFVHCLWTALFPGAADMSFVFALECGFGFSYGLRYLTEHENRRNLLFTEHGRVSAVETVATNMKRRREMRLCLQRPLPYRAEIPYLSRSGDPGRDLYAGFSVVLLILCVSSAVLAAAVKGLTFFVPVLTASLCLCASFAVDSAARLPFLAAQKRVRSFGGVMTGYRSVRRLGECDTFVVSDNDFFPKGTVTVDKIRFRPAFNASESIEYLAALLRSVRSPASNAVMKMITFDPDYLPVAQNVRQIPDSGVMCVINDHTVMVGGRNLMLAHNIAPLPQSKEASLRTATKTMMYLAIDGELAAMVLLKYEADPTLYDVLHRLHSEIGIVIDTADFNITESLVRKAYGLDSMRVVIPNTDERSQIERVRTKLAERDPKPAMIVTDKNTAVFFGRDAAKDIAFRMQTASRLEKIVTVAGLIIQTAAFLTVPDAVTPFWILLYQMIWFAPVAVLALKK